MTPPPRSFARGERYSSRSRPTGAYDDAGEASRRKRTAEVRSDTARAQGRQPSITLWLNDSAPPAAPQLPPF